MESKQTNREPLPTSFAEAMGEGYKVENGVVVAPIDTSKTTDALDCNERVVQAEGSNEPADKPATPNVPATAAQVEEEKKQVRAVQVELDQRGLPIPKDIDGAYRVAQLMLQGKAFPAWVKSPQQALIVSQFLRAVGLEPTTGIQHVCEVNGRLALWGEGPLAAVRNSGKMKDWKEFYIDKEYKQISVENKNLDAEIFAAVCRSVRADNGEKRETTFTTKDAATATQGLAAVWKGYKRIMFKRKARAEHIKDLYGDVIVGAAIAEYDFETAPDMPVEAQKTLADKLNERGNA